MLFFNRKRNRDKRQESETAQVAERALELARSGARVVLIRSTVIVAVLGSVWALAWALDRPISAVEVDGKFQRVSRGDVEQAIAPFRGEGFLSADLDALRHALEAIPWVDRARVERAWPNGVRAFVIEHVAAARWRERGLLNARGELFMRDAQHVPAELPLLEGPDGTEREVAQLYLDTNAKLALINMRLARVSLDARGAWELALSNGVNVRLGRQDVYHRLDRFVRAASPVIAARAGEVAYVDLRYSNGFAIGWNSRVARGSGERGAFTPDA
jgi:cell division protein FtsQ